MRVPPRQQLIVEDDLGGHIPKIEDGPWPAFPADLTSIALTVATQAFGTVLIFEKMFESRLFFVDKLVGMGARIILCDPHRAVVTGPAQLVGQRMESPDIRAGMAMLLAGLVPRGSRRSAPRIRSTRGTSGSTSACARSAPTSSASGLIPFEGWLELGTPSVFACRSRWPGAGGANVDTGCPCSIGCSCLLAEYSEFDVVVALAPATLRADAGRRRALGEALARQLRAPGRQGYGSAVLPGRRGACAGRRSRSPTAGARLERRSLRGARRRARHRPRHAASSAASPRAPGSRSTSA